MHFKLKTRKFNPAVSACQAIWTDTKHIDSASLYELKLLMSEVEVNSESKQVQIRPNTLFLILLDAFIVTY